MSIETYIHKKTGLEIKAEKFEKGMQDAWYCYKKQDFVDVPDNDSIAIVFVHQGSFPVASEIGIGDYLVHHKNYRFRFKKKEFEKLYKKI